MIETTAGFTASTRSAKFGTLVTAGAVICAAGTSLALWALEGAVAATKAVPPPRPARIARAEAPIQRRARGFSTERIVFSFSQALIRWPEVWSPPPFGSVSRALIIGNVAGCCWILTDLSVA